MQRAAGTGQGEHLGTVEGQPVNDRGLDAGFGAGRHLRVCNVARVGHVKVLPVDELTHHHHSRRVKMLPPERDHRYEDCEARGS